jgi:protein-tyrosine phosphatase
MRSKIYKAKLEDNVFVDSAGTSSHHQGSLPDRRSCEIALKFGLKLNHLSRPLEVGDFEEFDLLLVMDESNQNEAKKKSSLEIHFSKIHLITSIDSRSGAPNHVPDPYWSEIEDFEKMYHQLDYCCEQWLNKISTNFKV